MWTITTDQAAEMYARFCLSRYGAKAKQVVTAKALELRKAGDLEGERIWSQVRQHIEGPKPN
jgi:hypothetical protein